MKIDRRGPPEEITLAEFAERHNLTLRVEDKGKRLGFTRFEVFFLDVIMMDPQHCGIGKTEEEAIADYAKKISRGRIQIAEYRDKQIYDGRWIQIPWLK